MVEAVPEAARNDKNAFREFISTFLNAMEMLARADMWIGGKEVDVVLLRPAPEIIAATKGRILRAFAGISPLFFLKALHAD